VLLSFVLLAAFNKECWLEKAADPKCKRCAKIVAGGWGHSCVQLYDESMECVGSDKLGQLGDGAAGPASFKLTPASAFAEAGIKVAAIASGIDFTCVLTDDSKVFCVGEGRLGQLGHGRLDSSAVPVAVQGLKGTKITQMAAGWYHVAVLYQDGSVQVREDAALVITLDIIGAPTMLLVSSGNIDSAVKDKLLRTCALKHLFTTRS
jgi:alpha-tubulin suppressor-like RCC1 family protein